MKCYMSLNIKFILQYQFVYTRLSSAHTHTRKFVGVWALDKLVHTNRYSEITYNISLRKRANHTNHSTRDYFQQCNKMLTVQYIGIYWHM